METGNASVCTLIVEVQRAKEPEYLWTGRRFLVPVLVKLRGQCVVFLKLPALERIDDMAGIVR